MNWLIVEDEADIRSLVSMMCQVWGNVPMAYESGQKAWDWLDTVESGQYTGALPDFALMDIRMPGKRGNEISARMRTLPQLAHIPIVLMTAFVMSEDEMAKMMKEYGVDAVINKPLPDFDRLRTVLYDIINKKQADVAKAQASQPMPSPVETTSQPDATPEINATSDTDATSQPDAKSDTNATPDPEAKPEFTPIDAPTRPSRPPSLTPETPPDDKPEA